MSYAVFVGKNRSADWCAYLAGYGDEPSSHWLEVVPRTENEPDTEIEVGVTPEAWVVIEFSGGQGLWVAERLGADDIRVSRPGYILEVPSDYASHPDLLGSSNRRGSLASTPGGSGPRSLPHGWPLPHAATSSPSARSLIPFNIPTSM